MKKVMLILIILFCSVSHSFGNAKQEVTTLVNDQVNSLLEILKDNSIFKQKKVIKLLRLLINWWTLELCLDSVLENIGKK